MPSILKSQKIQEEVSKDGFDFKNVNDCILKLQEEIQEFKEALKTNDKQKCLMGLILAQEHNVKILQLRLLLILIL